MDSPSTQRTLCQRTRSGKLSLGVPISKKHDVKLTGKSVTVEKHQRSLPNSTPALISPRADRAKARESARVDTAARNPKPRVPVWLPPIQIEDVEDDEEDAFEADDFGPLRATPEHLVFTPTPPGQFHAVPNTYSSDSPMRPCLFGPRW